MDQFVDFTALRTELAPLYSHTGRPSIDPELMIRAVLHRSALVRDAPYPRQISGGAFEIGPAKFGHSVENSRADLGFRFLIFEVARF